MPQRSTSDSAKPSLAPRPGSSTAGASGTNVGAFRPIVGSRAALEVVDQITFAILSGTFAEGDRLPTIAELAAAMQVSRPVVGEAVKILAEVGVVDVQRGMTGGITVASAAIPPEVMKLSRQRRGGTLAQVVEARRPIEVEIARLAALRASETDFANMEEINQRLVASRGDPSRWREAHNAFHYAMGRAAGNEMLAFFQHEILEELALLLDNFDERYMEPDRTIREHQETLEALRSGDPLIATHAMSAHLVEFELLPDARRARTRSSKTRRNAS